MIDLDELIAEARRWANGHPNRRVSELIHGLVDALETATRVPVQGEPNNDRTPEFEAIEQELFKHQPLLSMQDGSIRGCKCMDRVFVTKTEDWGTHLAEVFTRLPRAVVPDAATEGDYHEGLEEGIKIGRAERDAALAAIERVRDLANSLRGRYADNGDAAYFTKQFLAALDGAPEPEEKP